MSGFGSLSRLVLGVALLAALAGARADDAPLPIFDAHLHYNWEPRPRYALEEVLALLRRNQVSGILATSRPNDGTRALHDARPAGIRVVPFLRPYRVRADIQSWMNDPSILDLVETEFRRGYYVGIGEFHLSGQAAATEGVRRIVHFAVERGLYLHAHVDEEALEILYRHNPKAKIIWAHTGFSVPAERIAAWLERQPALWCELSYRSGIVANGRLSDEWRRLFVRQPDRFLLGSDTWTDERWERYGTILDDYRRWLGELPRQIAERIAFRNAEGLFGR